MQFDSKNIGAGAKATGGHAKLNEVGFTVFNVHFCDGIGIDGTSGQDRIGKKHGLLVSLTVTQLGGPVKPGCVVEVRLEPVERRRAAREKLPASSARGMSTPSPCIEPLIEIQSKAAQ